MEIAGCRVQEKGHEGGMAVLYRVTPPAGAETCLLKMPKLGFGSDPACYAGFDVGWAGRFVLGMRPRQRRIARMIVWISLLEFVVFLFVAAIFRLERQGG